MNELILSKLEVNTLEGQGGLAGGFRRLTDTSLLTAAGGSTITLDAMQSGTLYEVNGTAANVVNMPALSTGNAGLTYDFLWTTANGAVTTTFVLPGSDVSNFFGHIVLTGAAGVATETFDVAGDTLTIIASTAVGARVTLTCLKDDGTNSSWKADIVASHLATID